MVGGVIGATSRWAVSETIGATEGWPWAVFVVNIIGCGILGWLIAHRAHLSDQMFAATAIGFCGALTTFSSFAVDLTVMLRGDRVALFAGYLLASFAAGAAAYVVGRRIGHLTTPEVTTP